MGDKALSKLVSVTNYKTLVDGKTIDFSKPSEAYETIDNLYKIDVKNEKEYERILDEKLNIARSRELRRIELMMHTNPIEYHKYFLDKEQQVSFFIGQIGLNITTLLLSVGFEKEQSAKIAVGLVKPFGDSLKNALLSLIKSKNELLNDKIEGYINKRDFKEVKKSDLGGDGSEGEDVDDTYKKYEQARAEERKLEEARLRSKIGSKPVDDVESIPSDLSSPKI